MIKTKSFNTGFSLVPLNFGPNQIDWGCWEVSKTQVKEILAQLDKNEKTTVQCECASCQPFGRNHYDVNKEQEYRLGRSLQIGCQLINAEIIDYAREWVMESKTFNLDALFGRV